MDLLETLKKFKKLEPEAGYTLRSRKIILSHGKARSWFLFKETLVSILQSGSAIALTAVLLVLVLGGFSVWKFFSATNPVGIDVAGLRAEAEAIGIQIQLTNIAYQESGLLNETSTIPLSNLLPRQTTKSPRAAKQTENLPVSSTSTSVLIDEALDKLSQ